ncbi:hypothetical protein [Sphingomonas oryzagri]
MGTKERTFRWSWLLAGSLLWIFAAYPLCLWMLGRYFQHNPEIALSRCGLLQSYDAYAYAQCMHDVADATAAQSGNISMMATLVAIGPIMLLWLILFLSRFARNCQTTDEACATPSSFYRNARRRRWEAP